MSRSACRRILIICYFAAALSSVPFALLRYRGLDTPAYHAAFFAVVSALIFIGSRIYYPFFDNGERAMRLSFAVMFVMYVILIVNFTVFEEYFGRIPVEVSDIGEYFDARCNFVPFATVRRMFRGYFSGSISFYGLSVNIAGNLAAFAPTTFFMPVMFRRCRRFGFYFAFLSAFIAAVELVQVLMRVGFCDIDDYILNALGASALFFILKIGALRRFLEKFTGVSYTEI